MKQKLRKNLKRLISCMMILAVIFSSGMVFAEEADTNITVTIDEKKMEFDVEPVILNNRVLVPFRAIFEALGCNVTYTEDEGRQLVTAMRGEKHLLIEIGADSMFFNGNEQTLDAPAFIKDGRTLVPIRAVSENFDANVDWKEDIKTVEITTKQGQHKITPVTAWKDIKSENGTTLINIRYSYPVIDNPENNEYISKLNDEYKEYATKFIEEAEANKEDSELLLEQKGEYYSPIVYELSYEVQADRLDILSITNYCYYNLGGAHPNTTRQSRTFDMKNEKELALSDVVNGNDDERHTMVYDVFIKYFEETYEGFNAEMAKQIDEEADNVHFYLTDDALVLYFDVYQVAPYVLQYPTVKLEYTEGVFKIDWSQN